MTDQAIRGDNLPDAELAKVIERLFLGQIAAAVELGRRSVAARRRRPLAPFNTVFLQRAWLAGRDQALEALESGVTP